MVAVCVIHALVQRAQPHVIDRDNGGFRQLRKYGDVTFVNAFGSGIGELSKSVFDLVVLDDSFMVNRSSPVWPELVRRVRPVLIQSRRRALFLQDDYTRLDVTVRLALKYDIDVFTVFSGINELYEKHGVASFPWLIGFADHDLDNELQAKTVTWSERKRDVGQRVTKTSLEFGNQGRLKATLAEKFHIEMVARGFSSDVSTADEDRFFGTEWFNFLADSRCTIGRHSGASLVTTSFRDTLRARAIERHYSHEPFERQLDRYRKSTMLEMDMLAPSPRMFEAASLGVVQVLESSHVDYGIKAWEHFVPISPDFSNIEEVASFLRSAEGPEMAMRCRNALYGDSRWNREVWFRRLAEHFKLSPVAVEGRLQVPESERIAFSKLSKLDRRVDRWKTLKKLESEKLIRRCSPIEAVFRWKPALRDSLRV